MLSGGSDYYSVLTNKAKASIITVAKSLRTCYWEIEQCMLLLRQVENNTRLAQARP